MLDAEIVSDQITTALETLVPSISYKLEEKILTQSICGRANIHSKLVMVAWRIGGGIEPRRLIAIPTVFETALRPLRGTIQVVVGGWGRI